MDFIIPWQRRNVKPEAEGIGNCASSNRCPVPANTPFPSGRKCGILIMLRFVENKGTLNCCLQYCCAQRLAFPFGEGAPVRTLGRKRFSQRHDDKHTGIYGKTPKRWFLPTAKRIFTLYQTSSVTQIGSEVPIWVPASPKGKPRALPRQCCKQQFTFPSKSTPLFRRFQ